MFEFLLKLFDTSDFPARWNCGNWTAGHGLLHVLSDLGGWSAYVAIPYVLGYFVLRRKDIPSRTIFLFFGAFILAYGTTHLMEILARDFPGMNQTIRLRSHQNDAVWRGMSAGNTLLAHAVGAGKTFTMAATGMKMKQAGLLHRPMYVVPNHLLEEFAREFMQLYPNAKLLVAAKKNLSRDRRKHLTTTIASGEWDGIIVTHSSFERIGMSREYQETFLRERIEEYDQLLREHAADRRTNRNLIKTLEKQKSRKPPASNA